MPNGIKTLENNTAHNNPITCLWRAVILVLLADIVRGRGAESEDAYRWMFENSYDFKFVCDLANMEPDTVKQTTLELLQKKAEGAKVGLGTIAGRVHVKRVHRGDYKRKRKKV